MPDATATPPTSRRPRLGSDASASSNVLEELIECQYRIGDVTVSELVPSPPDGGYGWVIVACAFCCNFIFDGCCYGFGIMLPVLHEKYEGSNAAIAFAGALCTAVMSVEGPFVSALVNKMGVRKVATAGAILSSLSLFASSFAPTLAWFWASYSVGAGIGMGMVFMPLCIHVGTYFESKRALATGLSVAGSGAGTFAVAPALAYALDNHGLARTLQLQAGVMLFAVVFTLAMSPVKAPPKAKELKAAIDEGEMVLKEAIDEMTNQPDGAERVSRRQSKRSTKGRSYRDLTRIKSRIVNLEEIESLARYHSRKEDTPASATVLNPVSRQGSLRGWFIPQPQPIDATTDRVDSTANVNSRPTSFARRNRSTIRQRHTRRPSTRLTAADYADSVHDLRQSEDGVTAAQTIAKLAHVDPTDFARPMARQDVLLSQFSIKHLPSFVKKEGMAAYREKQISVPFKEDTETTIAQRSQHFRSILFEMIDVSLLAHPGLLAICLMHVFAMLGLYTPFIFIGSRAVANGSPVAQAALLVSYIGRSMNPHWYCPGISNTIGRIVSGAFADLRLVTSLCISSLALCVCGCANLVLVATDTYMATVVYCIVFGFVIAAFLALTSIVLVEQVGIEKLTNAYGILAVFRGIALLFGSPLAGIVFDASGDYNLCFVLSGVLFIGAGLVGLVTLACQRRIEESDTADSEVMCETETSDMLTAKKDQVNNDFNANVTSA